MLLFDDAISRRCKLLASYSSGLYFSSGIEEWCILRIPKTVIKIDLTDSFKLSVEFSENDHDYVAASKAFHISYNSLLETDDSNTQSL